MRRTYLAPPAAVAALLFVSVLPGAAQSPRAAGLGEEISVELVNVEVHVVDGSGRPVAGLTRDAFRLLEDGQPVEITHFAWVGGHGPGASASGRRSATAADADEGAAAPRSIAVFFDESQIGVASRAPLVAALRDRLAEELGDDDRVSVARFTGAEVEQLLAPTTDRRRLARALEQLAAFSLGQVMAAQEFRTHFEMMKDEVVDGGIGRRTDSCPNMGQLVRMHADAVRARVEASAAAMLRYAEQHAHETGRKLLLHVSDGIPLVAGGEGYQFAIEMCSSKAAAEGVPGANSTFAADPSGEFQSDRFNPRTGALDSTGDVMSSLWTDVAARINALGITAYPILAAAPDSGLFSVVEPSILPVSVRMFAQQNPVDTLALLARETGGLVVRSDLGIDDALSTLLADLGGFYSLAFQPAPGGRPGLRRLEVEVAREGVELRYRKSYRRMNRDERIVGQLAALFDADRLDNPLEVQLGTRRPQPAAPERLQIVVPFARLTLIPGEAGAQGGRFTVYVATRRDGGRASGVRQRSISVTRSDPKALAYTYEIELPEQSAAVAVAVVDELSGTVAFARRALASR